MGNEKKSNKNSNKIFALMTYVLAFICLALGMFLPYNFAAENITSVMIGFQIPAAFDAVYKIGDGLQAMLNTPALDPTFSFTVMIADFAFDFGAALLVLYALVVVMGLFALIPVIASACSGKKKSKTYTDEVVKKNSNVALRAASFIEAFAILVLSAIALIQVTVLLLTADSILSFNYALLAAFGGTLLMLIVQAFFYKGGSGFIKFILALLSTLVIILVFDVTFIIPPVADLLKDIDLSTLLTVDGAQENLLAYVWLPLLGGTISFEGVEITVVITIISIMALGYLVFVNFVLDLMGLGKKTNKFMLVINIIRYLLEVIAAALILIMSFVIEGAEFGYLLIAILALAVLALIINIFRIVAFPKKKAAKSKSSEKAQSSEAPAKEAKKAKQQQPKPEKAHKETPVVAAEEKKEAAKEPEQKLYTPVIYNGQTDDFINTLANEQKIEFSRVFLERQNGALPQIPQYVVGGKNDKFFSSLFIYYAKVRDLISDELMNAFYKQANVM